MKIPKSFLLGVILILTIGCEKNVERGFLLTGNIEGLNNNFIYLKYGDHIDSSLVANELFIFKGKVAQPTKGVLFPDHPKSNGDMTVGTFMLENSAIRLSAKYSTGNTTMGATKFLDIDSINGSKSQDLRNDFESKINETVHAEKNDSIKKVLLYKSLYEFILKNPKSVMSGEFLADLNRSNDYLSGRQITILSKLIDTCYQEKIDIESIKKTIHKREMFAIGNIPPDIVLPDQDGKLIHRLSLNGKVVLLEFWASWCVPCRQANPELVNIYNELKSSEFEILGISIDQETDKWKTAIKKDHINWLQVIDSLRITEKTYHLNSIPFNLLLNREGRIIAQNIKPIELRAILDKEL